MLFLDHPESSFSDSDIRYLTGKKEFLLILLYKKWVIM